MATILANRKRYEKQMEGAVVKVRVQGFIRKFESLSVRTSGPTVAAIWKNQSNPARTGSL